MCPPFQTRLPCELYPYPQQWSRFFSVNSPNDFSTCHCLRPNGQNEFLPSDAFASKQPPACHNEGFMIFSFTIVFLNGFDQVLSDDKTRKDTCVGLLDMRTNDTSPSAVRSSYLSLRVHALTRHCIFKPSRGSRVGVSLLLKCTCVHCFGTCY